MIARGTRDLPALPMAVPSPEPRLGDRWWWSLQMEQLGRNMAVAGALELAYRLGRAHRDFEDMRRPKERASA